jgi:DNA-directed RNA polymerase sigma subunit (sigma70/sigma32)
VADYEFQERLKTELHDELRTFTEMEQRIAKLYFNLEGGYNLTTQEIGAIVKRNPDEVMLIVSKIRDHLERKELIHALPCRTR